MRIIRTLTLLLTATATLSAGSAAAIVVLRAPAVAGVVAAATTTTAPPTTSTIVAPTTTTTVIVAPPTTVGTPPTRFVKTLRAGDRGDEVLTLQRRLVELGYWLGRPDGTYGDQTVQAVTAFQKVHGMVRDGITGAAVATALADATRPTVKAAGDLVEIDKRHQVMLIVRGGTVEWVLSVSTGTERPYTVNGRTEVADTPAGDWRVGRVVDGVHHGELGAMYRPRFFHRDGIAVHGHRDVANYPASHGCVRVANATMDFIWSANLMPVGSRVVVD